MTPKVCKRCNGEGSIWEPSGTEDPAQYVPCPECSPWALQRKARAEVIRSVLGYPYMLGRDDGNTINALADALLRARADLRAAQRNVERLQPGKHSFVEELCSAK